MIYLVFLLGIINLYLVYKCTHMFDAYNMLQEDYERLNEITVRNYKRLSKNYTVLTITSLHTIHYLLVLLQQQNPDDDHFELYAKFFDDIVEKETKKYEKDGIDSDDE